MVIMYTKMFDSQLGREIFFEGKNGYPYDSKLCNAVLFSCVIMDFLKQGLMMLGHLITVL